MRNVAPWLAGAILLCVVVAVLAGLWASRRNGATFSIWVQWDSRNAPGVSQHKEGSDDDPEGTERPPAD